MVNIFNLTKCDERIQTRVSMMMIYRDIRYMERMWSIGLGRWT